MASWKIAEKVRKYLSNLLDPSFFIGGTYLVKLDIFYVRYRRMQGKVCLWNCGKMWKYARNVWLHLSSRLPLCWRNEGMPRLTTKNPLVNSIWSSHLNFFSNRHVQYGKMYIGMTTFKKEQVNVKFPESLEYEIYV